MRLPEGFIEALLELVNEENVTGNIEGYSTPKAFGKVKNKKPCKCTGYTEPKPSTQKNTIKEISYRDFRRDESQSHSLKINKGLVEINKRLEEIKKILDNNIKLKEEFQLSGKLWKSNSGRVNKVVEKLTYIGNKIKELRS